MNYIYSHRPQAGVSVGAFGSNGTLYVAFSLVNDGTSCQGNYWPEREDIFSRAVARQIIQGRIEHAISVENVDNPFVLSFETNMTAREFMADFRQTFKPTADETDDFLENSIQYESGEDSIDIRFRPAADQILERLTELATEVVANASARV